MYIMARSRTKSMKRSKIRKSGVKKYSRCKQRYRRKKTRAKTRTKTRARGKPKKQQEGGKGLGRRLRRKRESEPSPMANIAVEYKGGDFIVRFGYKDKAYSIIGPELIEFCKLADPEAMPEELPDYGVKPDGKKRDYNDHLDSFKKTQEEFKARVGPEIIQRLIQVPSMIKEMSQRESLDVEDMDNMLGELFRVILSEMDEETINIFLKFYAYEELVPNQ